MRYILLAISFGLFMACSSIYRNSEKARQLPPGEYMKRLAERPEAHRLDIRTPMEYRKGHLEGFENVNFLSFSFGRKIDSLDRSKPVFIYCATAHRSPVVAKKLLRRGFGEVIDLDGGYKALRKYRQKAK